MNNDTTNEAIRPPGVAGLEGLLARGDPFAAVSELIASTQRELAGRQVEGVSGGGAVRIAMNGERRITAVAIAPEVFAAGDAALLEDLVLAAANDAFERTGAIKAGALDAFSGIFGDNSG